MAGYKEMKLQRNPWSSLLAFKDNVTQSQVYQVKNKWCKNVSKHYIFTRKGHFGLKMLLTQKSPSVGFDQVMKGELYMNMLSESKWFCCVNTMFNSYTLWVVFDHWPSWVSEWTPHSYLTHGHATTDLWVCLFSKTSDSSFLLLRSGCLQSSGACTGIGIQWSPAEVSSGALSGHLLLCSVCLCRTRLAGVGNKEQRMNNLYFPLSQRLPTGLLSRKKYSWLAVSAWELVPDPAHCPPLQLSEILPRQKYQAAGFDYCLFILVPGEKECFLSFWTKPHFLSHIGLVAVKMTQMAGKAIVVPLMRPPEFLFDVACKFPFWAWWWGVCIHFPGIPTPSCQDYRLSWDRP